jgi:hypothetical protein
MKPKFKPGDKVKITLEFEVLAINEYSEINHYVLKNIMLDTNAFPDCKPFDRIAKLVPKKRVKK